MFASFPSLPPVQYVGGTPNFQPLAQTGYSSLQSLTGDLLGSVFSGTYGGDGGSVYGFQAQASASLVGYLGAPQMPYYANFQCPPPAPQPISYLPPLTGAAGYQPPPLTGAAGYDARTSVCTPFFGNPVPYQSNYASVFAGYQGYQSFGGYQNSPYYGAFQMQAPMPCGPQGYGPPPFFYGPGSLFGSQQGGYCMPAPPSCYPPPPPPPPPCPPPQAHHHHHHHHHHPEHPTTPPPPPTHQPPVVVGGNPTPPVQPPPPVTNPNEAHHYQPVPSTANDPSSWLAASRALESRLVGGSAQARSSISYGGKDPNTRDNDWQTRTAVWQTLQADDRLRYNVDTHRFFLSTEGGTNIDVVSLNQASYQFGVPGDLGFFRRQITGATSSQLSLFQGGKNPAAVSDEIRYFG